MVQTELEASLDYAVRYWLKSNNIGKRENRKEGRKKMEDGERIYISGLKDIVTSL